VCVFNAMYSGESILYFIKRSRNSLHVDACVPQPQVVAACDIPPGAVGPYSGLVLQDKEIVDVLSSPRHLLDVLHFW